MIKKNKPYYQPSSGIISQIKSGSERSNSNIIKFISSKLLNYVYFRIAYICPFNSWRVKLHRWRGVKIGENVMIGFHVTLDHSYPEYITIEDNVSLAGDNYILAHSNPYPHFKNILSSYVAPVVIKKGAWLGIGSMILPDSTVGENSIIAAGSVVSKSIPKLVVAGGVPAKVIKKIQSDKF